MLVKVFKLVIYKINKKAICKQNKLAGSDRSYFIRIVLLKMYTFVKQELFDSIDARFLS